MATFVLIHGAWHGGWCWEEVIPRLEALGHKALAPDLPGHAKHGPPLHEVSLARYCDAVAGLILEQSDNVILAGHSMGGVVISQVAEQIPQRIARLVYLTAILPRDGASLMETNRDDSESLLVRNRVLSEDRRYMTLKPDGVIPMFYHDCPEPVAQRAIARLVPQPVAPIATPVHLTSGNWGTIPRTYIKCLRDRALTPQLQEAMIEAQPCRPVHELDTGHFPQYAAPAALCDILHQEARPA